jgi:cytochrome c-type biogenesis protein CcmH
MAAHTAAIAEVEALAERAEAAGSDPALWIDLGQRAMALGMAERAAAALGRAVDLTRGDPLVTAAWGEALVQASGGMVTEEARAAFERALAARPQDPRARYYLALARAQAGDDEGALAAWQALAAASPADAPWRPAVEARIAEAAGRLGQDPRAAVPPPAPGPSAAEVERAAAMSPEEQTAMIESMVAGLAARLEAAPDDAQGWLRLGKAYEVLGRREERLTALRRAVEAAPEDPAALAALGEALAAEAPAEGPLGAELVGVMERLAAADPSSLSAMWFLGVHAMEEGRPADARRLWGTLLERLPPGSPEHEAVRSRLEALPAG